MGYTNSPLVAYTRLSPNHSGQRTHAIDRISPHCVVGQCTVETLGEIFAPTSKKASSNYGIGKDGECASDTFHPYAMTDAVYASLIELCADICRRNGKTKLLWLGDKDTTLAYEPKEGEMVLTVHRWFANKSCPGDWLYSRLPDLAARVTAALAPVVRLDNTPSAWAKEAVDWAVGAGIMAGGSGGDLMLHSPVTREQLCVFLHRYRELYGEM